MTDLSGKIALVSGASRGISRAIAAALARAGADVAVNYRGREADARETAAQVTALGRRALVVAADLSVAAEVARLVAEVEAGLGPVDTRSALPLLPLDFLPPVTKCWNTRRPAGQYQEEALGEGGAGMGVNGLQRAIRGLAASLGQPNPGDAELLGRLVGTGDQAAFECLVRRHGPMVLATCRRVLGNEADAEDAFQAAFLVLARKAASVRPAGALAAWLHGVACKTARQARRADARRRANEARAARCEACREADDSLREALDLELSRLPGKYREVVVLCDLEGLGRKEAALLLGCPEGTVASRLDRGRCLLARRLGRQGLGPAASPAVTPPPVPASLVAGTVEAARLFGLPGKAVLLAEGVIRAMFLTKLKVAAAVVLAVGVVAAGVGGGITPGGPPGVPAPKSGPRAKPDGRGAVRQDGKPAAGEAGESPADSFLRRRLGRLRVVQENGEDATDEQFIRRVSLDLRGVVPPAAEVGEFRRNKDPKKRKKLVARLAGAAFAGAELERTLKWLPDDEARLLALDALEARIGKLKEEIRKRSARKGK